MQLAGKPGSRERVPGIGTFLLRTLTTEEVGQAVSGRSTAG